MSWQDDLKQLDTELSEGKITIEEHRKRRDSLLAAASSTATTRAPEAPAQPTQVTQPAQPEQAASPASPQPPSPQPEAPQQAATAQAASTTPGSETPAPSSEGGAAQASSEAHTGSAPDGAAAAQEHPAASAPVGPVTGQEHPAAGQDQAAAATQEQPPAQPDQGTVTFQPDPQATQVQQPVQPPAGDANPTSWVVRAATQQQPPVSPESPAEQTQWVARNPAQAGHVAQAFGNPGPPADRTQSIQPSWESPAERTQRVHIPQEGQPPYSPLASGLQQNRAGGNRPGASAGEAWQPMWNREWEPGPGGAPFDPFAQRPPDPTDSFAAEPKKKSGFGNPKVLASIAGAVLLALVGLGLWLFVFSGDDSAPPPQAGGGGNGAVEKPMPGDLDAMIQALPQLPGVPDDQIGPTIPAATAAGQGLYPAETADKLSRGGNPEVVYRASTDGTRQYGVLAVRSDDAQGIRSDILTQQTETGWQEAQQPNTPAGGIGLERTTDGITFHRVLYTTGPWTIFVGVSPTEAGNDAQVEQEFGNLVKSVTDALPAGR